MATDHKKSTFFFCLNLNKSVSFGEIDKINSGIITAKYSGICGGFIYLLFFEE